MTPATPHLLGEEVADVVNDGLPIQPFAAPGDLALHLPAERSGGGFSVIATSCTASWRAALSNMARYLAFSTHRTLPATRPTKLGLCPSCATSTSCLYRNPTKSHTLPGGLNVQATMKLS